jgi:hypothetical protein
MDDMLRQVNPLLPGAAGRQPRGNGTPQRRRNARTGPPGNAPAAADAADADAAEPAFDAGEVDPAEALLEELDRLRATGQHEGESGTSAIRAIRARKAYQPEPPAAAPGAEPPAAPDGG